MEQQFIARCIPPCGIGLRYQTYMVLTCEIKCPIILKALDVTRYVDVIPQQQGVLDSSQKCWGALSQKLRGLRGPML